MAWEKEKQTYSRMFQQAPDVSNYIRGFGSSALWSIPEIVGFEPPMSTEVWRGQNPTGALASQIAGTAVPYAGGAAMLGKIPQVGRAMEAAKGIRSPLASGVARGALSIAPFEAARVAGAAALDVSGLGKQLAEQMGAGGFAGTGEVAQSAIFETAIGGALGGIIGGVKGYGAKLPKKDTLPGVNWDNPPSLQLRQLNQTLATGNLPDDVKLAAEGARTNLMMEVRREVLPPSARYAKERDVHRLFTLGGNSKTLVKRPLIVTDSMPKDRLEALENLAGFTPGWEASVRWPRMIEIKGKSGTKGIRAGLGKMTRVADDAWMYQDDGDDLFTVVKKVQGDGKKFAEGDSFILFKTDEPGKFMPGNKRYADLRARTESWLHDTPKVDKINEPVFDSVVANKAAMKVDDMRNLQQVSGNLGKAAEKVASMRGIKDFLDETGEVRGLFKQRFRDTFQPAMRYFKNPLAQRAFVGFREAFEAADNMTQHRFFGARGYDTSKPWKALTVGGATPDPNSLDAVISRAFKHKDTPLKIQLAQQARMDIPTATRDLGLNKDQIDLLKMLKQQDEFGIARQNRVEQAVGAKVTKPLENHYGLSHRWEGDFRAAVRDESGNLRFVGAGNSRQQAIAEAEEYVQAAKEMGRDFKIAEVSIRDFKKDQSLMHSMVEERLKPTKTTSVRTKARHGVGGYIGDRAPMTEAQFRDNLLSNIREQERYIAGLAAKHVYADDLTRLGVYNPHEANQLAGRLDAMEGKQGPFGEWVNKQADKVLAPVLGKDSASKIIGAMNAYTYRIVLGFANVSYAVANMLQFVTTSLPQMALLANMPHERAVMYYSHFPSYVKGTSSFSVFDGFKITKDAFRLMGNPDADFVRGLDRAMGEGVVAPRFMETMVGQNSRAVVGLRDALRSGNFTDGLKAIADFLPATSEKLSRGLSFAMGWKFGQNVLGIGNQDDLYRFAKEFTEKSSFLYSSADRANIITGPMGGAFGLFKNWMMHYIDWLSVYAGEGVMYGNWKPLLWAVGGTAAMGGVGGLGPATYIADRASEWMTNESLMKNTYDMFGGGADMVYYGLPALMGVSLQAQLQLPFTDPGRDAAYMFQLAYVDMGKNLANAWQAGVDHMTATGQSPLKDEGFLRSMAKATAPKVLHRALQMRGDQVLSIKTGYPNVDGMGPGAKAAYLLGVNPLEIEKTFAVSNELWTKQEARKKDIQARGEAWAQAMMAGDWREAKLVELRAAQQGADVGSVLNSGEARLANMRRGSVLDRYKKEDAGVWRALGF